MEDYIEMIYRKTINNNEITIKELAECLNVKPSSVSKMANKTLPFWRELFQAKF